MPSAHQLQINNERAVIAVLDPFAVGANPDGLNALVPPFGNETVIEVVVPFTATSKIVRLMLLAAEFLPEELMISAHHPEPLTNVVIAKNVHVTDQHRGRGRKKFIVEIQRPADDCSVGWVFCALLDPGGEEIEVRSAASHTNRQEEVQTPPRSARALKPALSKS
jgi:hypothetical protein